MNEQPTSRENIDQTRQQLISKLDFLLKQGFEQAYQVDKSLLTLSAGALALSLTFVGNLSGTKHYLGFLFVAWAFFTVSIITVIFAMRKAQLATHDDARQTADNLETLSSLPDGLAGIMRATFPAATNKRVARLNSIAIWSFVIGVIFLCLFVGSNLLTSSRASAIVACNDKGLTASFCGGDTFSLPLFDAAPTPSGFAKIVSDDFPIPFHSLHRAVSTTAKHVNFVIDLRLRSSPRFI